MCSNLFLDPSMPCLMGRKGIEVFRLKLYYERKISLSLSGHCIWSASIISAMPKFFAHEPSRVMTIVRLFSEYSISFQVPRPRKIGPTYSGDSCVQVSRLTGIQIVASFKDVPFDCSDDTGLSLFCIKVG